MISKNRLKDLKKLTQKKFRNSSPEILVEGKRIIEQIGSPYQVRAYRCTVFSATRVRARDILDFTVPISHPNISEIWS